MLFGCTPPESRYYGLQTYAFISDDHLLFSSMGMLWYGIWEVACVFIVLLISQIALTIHTGDSVNFDKINTTQPAYPYDTPMLMVTTGDVKV